MKRKNATRSALFTSIISLLLCVSMLVGTTFAWFTDTAASGLNQIIAGNLDVELLYKDGDAYKNAADVKLFDDIELWEPGMVVYETVKIANVGNLALKYALSINTGNENFLNGHGLSEVLHFAVIDGEIAKTLSRSEVLAMAEGSADKGMLTSYTFNNQFSLEAKTESDPMTLIVYWPENGETDNLYNANNGQTTSDGAPLHIDLGLKVFASQETVEEDSFDEYYDDTASYPENMWLGDVAEALVIDEGTKTISISSGAELALLAKKVNEGNDYAGYTVTLTDSIDLNNIAWTPIGAFTFDRNNSGSYSVTAAFKGTFDGANHTIYNLKSDVTGLFAVTDGATIKNVTVKNVNIVGDNTLAAIVGYAKTTTTIENCHVAGKINIVADWAYVGGIAAYGYANISNCSVIADNTGVITSANRNAVAGIMGWNYGSYIINCTVKNLNVTGWANVAGVAGYVPGGHTISGCTVENVTLTKTRVGGNPSIGLASGGWSYNASKAITVKGNTFKNVTVIGAVNKNYAVDSEVVKFVGSEYEGKTTTNFVIENNTITDVTIQMPDKMIDGTTITLYKAETPQAGGKIYLNSPEDFKYLNDLVNNWKTLTGSDGTDNYYYHMAWTVYLNCDVDLANEPWTPVAIGYFGGFDGQNHTISNLTITGENQVGLFSTTYNNDSGKCPISNLVIDGATVTGEEVVGVVVGWGTTPITNVTVKNATVNGAKYVGGVAGKSQNAVENCAVIDSSVIGTGKEVGGIVGFLDIGESAAEDAVYTVNVKDNEVKNSTVTGTEEVGGIVGRAYARKSTKIDFTGNTFDGIVNATTETKWVDEILGRDYDGSGITIDGLVLAGTAEALAAALTKNGSVALSADIKAENVVALAEISDGVNATLDLNGYDINAKLDGSAGWSQIFRVSKGATFTVKGEGNVHATAYASLTYGSVIFNNVGGNLIIEGGNYTMT